MSGVAWRTDVGNVAAFYSGAAQQVNAVGDAVEFVENHSLYSGLDDEFGTVETRRRGDVERRTLGRIV